jgi:hypothetical protein
MSDMNRRPNSTGVFFNPSRDRGAAFQSGCAELFSQLSACESVDALGRAGTARSGLLILGPQRLNT